MYREEAMRAAVGAEMDYADLMERVADYFDAPEPTEAEVEAWLQRDHNRDQMEEAMYYAACRYIRDHWKSERK